MGSLRVGLSEARGQRTGYGPTINVLRTWTCKPRSCAETCNCRQCVQ